MLLKNALGKRLIFGGFEETTGSTFVTFSILAAGMALAEGDCLGEALEKRVGPGRGGGPRPEARRKPRKDP